MSFPKILIFGQGFNNYSGGGITLTNLFKGWPKENIAVTYIGHGLRNVTTDICDTYYQLGGEEHKWIFPLNLFQRQFQSGQKSFGQKKDAPVNSSQTGLRYRIVNWYFFPFLRWMGLFHIVSRLNVSERMKNWLSDYRPGILYLQVSTLEDIFFAEELIGFLKIPSIVHVMDDWPSTVSSSGLFRKFWEKKINREFKKLLGRIDLHLSISDAMSEEYEKRYCKKFIPFHNPIEIDSWLPNIKTTFKISTDYITILYSGRIGGNGIADSLMEVASAIDSMSNDHQMNIKLHIQSPTRKKEILDMLQKFNCVVINPFAEYSRIPAIFSSADILLLANDFNAMGIKYLKLSMPTKASEYMISGAPILVYASESVAVTKFFIQNNCGYCVTKQSKSEIQKAIIRLIEDEDLRATLSHRAVTLAREKFDAEIVRSHFQNLLINLYKSKNYVHQ